MIKLRLMASAQRDRLLEICARLGELPKKICRGRASAMISPVARVPEAFREAQISLRQLMATLPIAASDCGRTRGPSARENSCARFAEALAKFAGPLVGLLNLGSAITPGGLPARAPIASCSCNSRSSF